MTPDLMLLASQAGVIATALVAGVFLTFSDFVMKSLAASQSQAGIEAMQQINRKVMPTLFMLLFLGLVPGLSMLGFFAVGSESESTGVQWVIASAALYIIGCFGVTMVGNVPMNNRLAGMVFDSAEAAAYWPDYVRRWTRLNTVRTLASTGASLCLLTAVTQLSRG
jgi:uncharacterized membrane protein